MAYVSVCVLLLYCIYIIMELPGDGCAGGGGGGGGGRNETTCFVLISFHGMVPVIPDDDGGNYHVVAAPFPDGVTTVVSPNNLGYPELVDETHGCETHITTFLRWAWERQTAVGKTPDTLSYEFNDFEKRQMDRLNRQIESKRTQDRVLLLDMEMATHRKSTNDNYGPLYASHTLFDVVKTIKDKAGITWMSHNTGFSPEKRFGSGGACNQCLFYFTDVDYLSDEISNKLVDWKRNMRSGGNPKCKTVNDENVELCRGLSLTFERNVLTIQFDFGRQLSDQWFDVSLTELFGLLKRVISFSLGSLGVEFVSDHMSNCCIADATCSVYSPLTSVSKPRQQLTFLGPKTDSPAAAAAAADGSTRFIISIDAVSSIHPPSYWDAYSQLKKTHQQQLVAAPRRAGSNLHELMVPGSLSSFLPDLRSISTEPVHQYVPKQPVDFGIGWTTGPGGVLVVPRDSSSLDDSCGVEALDSLGNGETFGEVSSPVYSQVFSPDSPPTGGRRCSKKNKNRKTKNRKTKRMKTVRNKRRRKNMSVRHRG